MSEEPETRQERRERRLKKARERMVKHGKALGKIYQDIILKRRGKKTDGESEGATK